MWTARWIWHEKHRAEGTFWEGLRAPAEAANRFCMLRRSFHWDGGGPVTALVTADSRYVLWVNGAEVSRGPIRAGAPAWLPVDHVELTPFLQRGDNAVAALCRFYGRANVWWQPASPVARLGMGSFLFEATGPGFSLGSDRSWRARPAPYQQDVPASPVNAPPPEVVDMRDMPEGWTEAGFDDSSWAEAQEIRAGWVGNATPRPPSDPFPLLPPNPLPPPHEEMVAASSRGGGVWDLGRLCTGLPVVEIDARGGETIAITGGEDLDAGGQPVAAPRHWSLTATCRSGRNRIEAFEPVGLRYLHAPGAAAVSMRERHFPRPAGPFFECSDDVLTRTWQVGARTLDLCSTDAFLDCPGREQRAWLGDAYVHTVTSLVCNPDERLVRRHLRLCAEGRRADGLLPMAAGCDIAGGPQTIPDYSLHWLRSLARAVTHSGDTTLAAELLPTAAGIITYYEAFVADDGLLHSVPGWIFIDWAQTQRGECIAALNGLYVLALDDWARLLAAVGDEQGARRARRLADRSRAALRAFWDPERAAVTDILGGRRASQQSAAVLILAGGLGAGEEVRALDRALDPARVALTATPADFGGDGGALTQGQDPASFDEEEQVVAAQPFFRHFVHQAVAKVGRWDTLVTLCRDWEHQLDSTTLWEYWHMEPGTGSRCHAWSSTAVHDLTRWVLGVQVAGDDLVVDPHLGALQWARGATPTSRGLVTVSVRAGAPPEVQVPQGVRVAHVVRLPDATWAVTRSR